MRRVPIESRYKDIFANRTEQARVDACMVYMYRVYACLVPRIYVPSPSLKSSVIIILIIIIIIAI